MPLSDKRGCLCAIWVLVKTGLEVSKEEEKKQGEIHAAQISSYISSFNPYHIPGKQVLLIRFKNEELEGPNINR